MYVIVTRVAFWNAKISNEFYSREKCETNCSFYLTKYYLFLRFQNFVLKCLYYLKYSESDRSSVIYLNLILLKKFDEKLV